MNLRFTHKNRIIRRVYGGLFDGQVRRLEDLSILHSQFSIYLTVSPLLTRGLLQRGYLSRLQLGKLAEPDELAGL